MASWLRHQCRYARRRWGPQAPCSNHGDNRASTLAAPWISFTGHTKKKPRRVGRQGGGTAREIAGATAEVRERESMRYDPNDGRRRGGGPARAGYQRARRKHVRADVVAIASREDGGPKCPSAQVARSEEGDSGINPARTGTTDQCARGERKRRRGAAWSWQAVGGLAPADE